ncbi:DUF2196 domain-containing protein [Neobacillus pocheonensis]|uniref:DUF2196 domain-containing protein n=1 Tax=Neobacillus pocheonensis TaxID=363869 RepID=UPI003D2D508C
MSGTIRENIKPGIKVRVVQKQDQRTGKLIEGIVSKLLTKSAKRLVTIISPVFSVMIS